jgi:hypothetical protein
MLSKTLCHAPRTGQSAPAILDGAQPLHCAGARLTRGGDMDQSTTVRVDGLPVPDCRVEIYLVAVRR